MVKRMVLMLAMMLVLIALLGVFKFQQIQAAMARGAAFQPPPAAVTTIVAAPEEWPATLSAIGTLAAVQGVTVSADLPGIDRSHHLRVGSGRPSRRGAWRSSTPVRNAHNSRRSKRSVSWHVSTTSG